MELRLPFLRRIMLRSVAELPTRDPAAIKARTAALMDAPVVKVGASSSNNEGSKVPALMLPTVSSSPAPITRDTLSAITSDVVIVTFSSTSLNVD